MPNQKGETGMFASAFIDVSKQLAQASDVLKQLLLDRKKEAIPTTRWVSDDFVKLNSVADVVVDDQVSESTWSEIIGMMVPFFCHMCDNSMISKIGVSSYSKRVDLLLSNCSLIDLRNVVKYYCSWQDNNKEIPYFDINVVGLSEFNANHYKMIVTPKKSGAQNASNSSGTYQE